MDIEELAKNMREHAIDKMTPEERRRRDAKTIQQKEIQRIKKLYFNAGRWAGGARDRKAREAFQRITNGY